jgi:hypothetical protein
LTGHPVTPTRSTSFSVHDAGGCFASDVATLAEAVSLAEDAAEMSGFTTVVAHMSSGENRSLGCFDQHGAV